MVKKFPLEAICKRYLYNFLFEKEEVKSMIKQELDWYGHFLEGLDGEEKDYLHYLKIKEEKREHWRLK